MKKAVSQRRAGELSPEQEEEAQRIFQKIKDKVNAEVLDMVRHMVGKPVHEIFGAGEFELRDKLNEVGTKILQESANERAKKGVPR
jgi:hypothetical protein